MDDAQLLDLRARLQPSSGPVPAPLAPHFAALLDGVRAGVLTPVVLWDALRAARDLAAGVPGGPAPGWSATTQPLPGLGRALVARAPDGAELGFRLDAAGVPCGGVSVETPDLVVALAIADGPRLQGWLGERELDLELGPPPPGCWTSRPLPGAFDLFERGSLAAAFTARCAAEVGPAAAFRLIYVAGPIPFDDVPLGGPLVVGREPSCGLPLDDVRISRQHALLEPLPDGVRVSDLGSGNGTYLNRRRLGSPAQAAPGDEIVVGDTHFKLGRK